MCTQTCTYTNLVIQTILIFAIVTSTCVDLICIKNNNTAYPAQPFMQGGKSKLFLVPLTAGAKLGLDLAVHGA